MYKIVTQLRNERYNLVSWKCEFWNRKLEYLARLRISNFNGIQNTGRAWSGLVLKSFNGDKNLKWKPRSPILFSMLQQDAKLFIQEICGSAWFIKGTYQWDWLTIFFIYIAPAQVSCTIDCSFFSSLDSNLRRSFEIESLLPTINDEGSRRSAYWITGGSFKFEVSLFNPTRMPFLQEVETLYFTYSCEDYLPARH